VFGLALCSSHSNKNIIFGQYLALTPSHHQKNYAFVLPDGKILAFGKATVGTNKSEGLEGFGVTSDEKSNYPKLWRNGRIYEPQAN
jgi:Uma2 family endonuclease